MRKSTHRVAAFAALVLSTGVLGVIAVADAPAAQSVNICGVGTFAGDIANSWTCTYADPGASTFTVPAGITELNFDVNGAEGGLNSNHPEVSAGLGGESFATHAVTEGEVLAVNVGGVGGSVGEGSSATPGAGGANGGAAGGPCLSSDADGGGGGGASDVRRGGTSLANRLLVAGGGGGTGGSNRFGIAGTRQGFGGDGGGRTGASGVNGGRTSSGGRGGTQSGGGAGGDNPYSDGIAGTAGAGGAGGGSSTSGCDGGGGGGGGGGYFGGGGGTGDGDAGGGGGGGGAGFIAATATNAGFSTGVRSGSGLVAISSVRAINVCGYGVFNAAAGTCTYTTPRIDTFTAPAGVTTATFVLSGGSGGKAIFGAGGARGGKTTATLAITSGQVLEIGVGGQGGSTGTGSGEYPYMAPGGFNGGGLGGIEGSINCASTGGNGAGAGGGASDVRTASGTALAVAGGGGGGANSGAGGAGGGLAGVNGDSGSPGSFTSGGGQGGSASAGGAAGSGGHTSAFGVPATPGVAGQGGAGGAWVGSPACGGGGGGGYYGGGGGEQGTGGQGAGGGGGGSGFVAASATATTLETGTAAASPDGSVVVTFVPPTIAVSVSGSKSFGSSSSTFTQTNNAPGGITLSGTLSCSTVGASTPINASLPVGNHTVLGSSCSGLAASGYTLTYTGVTDGFVVSPGSVAVSVSGSKSFGSSSSTFTQTNNAPGGVTLSGTLSCSTVGASTPINGSLAVGNHTVLGSSCSGLSASGYTLTYTGVTNGFVVSPGSITVNVSGSKAFGSASSSFTQTNTSGVTLSGTLSCSTVGASTPINASLPVGNHTVLGSSCSGLSASGYTLTYTGVTNGFVVSPGSITVNVSGSKVFASSTSAFTETDNAPGGVTVSGTLSCTTVGASTPINASLPVGNHTVLGSSCSGLSASGYTLTYTGVTNAFVVSAGTITVDVSGSKPFGSSASTFTETDDAPSGGTLSGTLSCTTVSTATPIDESLPVGNHTVLGSSCSGLSASGYDLAYTGVTDGFVVSPGSITVNVSGSKNFGEANFVLTETDDAPSGVTLSGSLFCFFVDPSTFIDASLPVGNYTVVSGSCSGLSAPSGFDVTYTGVADGFVVSSAPVTVNVSGSMIFGSSTPAFTETEDPYWANLSGTLACTTVGSSTGIDASLPVGNYTVLGSSCSGLSATGYDVTYTGVTDGFVVSPDSVAISVDAVTASKTYGDADPSEYFWTYSGGTPTGVAGAASCARTTGESAGGTSMITCDPGSLAASGYTFVTGADAAFTINKATLTLVVDPKSRVFSAPNPTFTGTLGGVKNGEPLTVTYATLAGAASTPGSYAITPTLHDVAGELANYNLPSNTGILTITKAAATSVVTRTPNPSTYGTPLTITATLTPTAPATAIPSGTVTFFDGTVQLGTAALDATGVATLVRSTLGVGTHQLSAKHAATSTFTAANSAPASQTVSKAATKMTATPSHTAVSAKLLRTDDGRPVAGQRVTFKAGTTLVCTATTNAAGVAKCPTPTGAKANAIRNNHGYTATYAATANYLGATARAGLT